MFAWLKQIFGDNGESDAAVVAFREQHRRSVAVRGELENTAQRLAEARAATVAKAQAVQQEQERVSVTDIKTTGSSLGA